MKRIFIIILLIALPCCVVLMLSVHFPPVLICYHFISLSAVLLAASVIYRTLAFLQHDRLRVVIQHVFAFSFFLSISIFYLVLLVSNLAWGKMLELKLLIRYLASLQSLFDILPVREWILYAALVLFFVLVVFLYLAARPNTRRMPPSLLIPQLIRTGLLLAVIAVFYQPLIYFKRQLHAAREPILAFVFPRSFHNESEMSNYGRRLLSSAGMDRDCIQAVKKEPVHPAQRNVILIVVDGLPRNLLALYHKGGAETPFLGSMLQEGSLQKVSYAFSPSTSTLGGMANIFSSADGEHFSFAGLRLMRYMKLKNFTTYTFLTGAHTEWYWLVDLYRKYTDFFYESKDDLVMGADDDLVTAKKFSSTALRAPFFAYIHLMSAHIMGKKHPEYKAWFPDKMGPGIDKKTALVNNMKNGILQMDAVVRSVFDQLLEQDQLAQTTVFIVADHGELFGEDDRWGHNKSLHPALQTIPMLMYDSDPSWYKNTLSATLLDIAPTIADRLGYAIPACWSGRSLHRAYAPYEVNLLGEQPCDLPYGKISARADSSFTMELMDGEHRLKRRFSLDREAGIWLGHMVNNGRNYGTLHLKHHSHRKQLIRI